MNRFIHLGSNAGWIGPLWWINTRQVDDGRFPGFWGEAGLWPFKQEVSSRLGWPRPIAHPRSYRIPWIHVTFEWGRVGPFWWCNSSTMPQPDFYMLARARRWGDFRLLWREPEIGHTIFSREVYDVQPIRYHFSVDFAEP